jgi:predicted SnoaL-like aldol condensation-catalyzing enzyme/quinol monooxygenase YgiN
MVTLGFHVQLTVKPERAQELEARLRATVANIEREPGTIAWFALRLGPSQYAVVDVFEDEAGREAHAVAGAPRVAGLAELLAAPPTTLRTEVIAAKLPAASADVRDANKRTVLAFYEVAIRQKDFAAARELVGPHYLQHNPLIGDGLPGLEGFLAELRDRFPGLRAEVKRIFADGDFVIAHVHGIRSPGERGSAIIDIFRLEHGKIVEHWDVMQPVPETAANPNTMF